MRSMKGCLGPLTYTPHEFAISEGQDVPPSDLVDPDIWHGIMHLPEDVSIRISDHNGLRLRLMYQLWGFGEIGWKPSATQMSRMRCSIVYWKQPIASKAQPSISCMDLP